MSLSYNKEKKIVHLPGLKEVAEYNGDVIIPGGLEEDTEEARIKKMEEIAKETVRQAKEEAAQLLEEAKVQAEQLRKEASEQGYKEGRALGKSEYDAMVMEQKQRFAGMMSQLSEYRDNMFDDIKSSMTDIVLYLTKRILYHTFDENNEPINNMIFEMVDRLRDQASITVKVNAEDFGKLDVDRLENNGVTLEMDEKLNHGDIVIVTEAETIDMGLDGQLDRLKKEIKD